MAILTTVFNYLRPYFVSWKTTVAGLSLIFAGLAHIFDELVKFVNGDTPNMEVMKQGGIALAGGFGLLFAKDGNKSNAITPTVTPVSTPSAKP